MNEGQPIRVGIIGAGNISRNHVEGYLDSGANVVAIADPNQVALDTRSREWGVNRAFTDYQDLLDQPDIDAVSICAPNAVTNAEFTRVLAEELHRPGVLAVPAFALRLALGEFSADVLAGQHALPEVLTKAGFRFEHPELPEALRWALAH